MNNIPPTLHTECVNQLVRYARSCFNSQDFADSEKLRIVNCYRVTAEKKLLGSNIRLDLQTEFMSLK